MDVTRMLVEEEAGWRRLHEVFARVPPERFEEPGVTPDGWSPKDVMFHVAAWLAECARAQERIAHGTFRPEEEDDDFDRVNREWFELSRTMDSRTVRAELSASRQKARDCFTSVRPMTPEAWEWFDESGPIHYDKHVRDLEAWLG